MCPKVSCLMCVVFHFPFVRSYVHVYWPKLGQQTDRRTYWLTLLRRLTRQSISAQLLAAGHLTHTQKRTVCQQTWPNSAIDVLSLSLTHTHTLGKNINHCQSKHYSAAGCSVINSTVEESLLLFTLHCLCTFIFDSQQASRLNTDFVCFLQCSTHKKIFYLNSFQFHLTCSNGIFHDSICFPKHTNATSI